LLRTRIFEGSHLLQPLIEPLLQLLDLPLASLQLALQSGQLVLEPLLLGDVASFLLKQGDLLLFFPLKALLAEVLRLLLSMGNLEGEGLPLAVELGLLSGQLRLVAGSLISANADFIHEELNF
jgi:hypothetical protein